MAFTIADRVQQTSTTESTGSYSLGGTVSGFRSFSSAIGSNQVSYTATMGNQFEVGVGTLSGSTLTRAVIYSSSNSNNLVSWGAGTKQIFVDMPAAYLDQIYKYAPKYVGTFGGSSSAWTATLSPPLYTYWEGLTIIGKIGSGNTTATPTVNISGLGAVNVRMWSGASINTTNILPAMLIIMVYNGSTFHIMAGAGHALP